MSTTTGGRKPPATELRRRANGEGSIRPDAARGGYRVEVTIPGTTRKRTTRTKDRPGALAALHRLQREVENLAPRAPAPRGQDNWTVGTWIRYWHENVAAHRPGRFDTGLSTSRLNTLDWMVDDIAATLGRHSLLNLRREHVQTWLRDRSEGIGTKRGRPWSRETCRIVRNTLADALDEAMELTYVARNVARTKELPPGRSAKKRHSLSTKDARRLFEAARAMERTVGQVIALQLVTGMRPGEARGLRWGDVDLSAAVLRVRKAKTERGLRTVRLGAAALAILRDQSKAAGLTVRDPKASVFRGERSATVSRQCHLDTVTALCDELGIEVGGEHPVTDPKRLPVPHEMRHTAGSLLLDMGMRDYDVADMMGMGIETFRSVYRHQLGETVGDRAVPLLDAFFGACVVSDDTGPVLPLYLNHDEVDVLGLALAALRHYDQRVLAAPPDERFGPELDRADQVHAAARQRVRVAASLRTALAELATALERTA